MNKILLGLAILGLGIPMVAGAAGGHTPGTVYINIDNTNTAVMMASYNVRFNPAAAGGSYVRILDYGSPDGNIIIAGHDGAKQFECSYTPDLNGIFHPAAELARDLARGAGNGTFIYVSRTSTYDCDVLYIQNSSDRLN
jgi:hypothetical protein